MAPLRPCGDRPGTWLRREDGLNCIRVFLQSLVYHHDPKLFVANFDDFLATADKHGLKVMPILFDSCFGVAPSLESRGIWVANPGPDRMDKQWWPESDAYAKAVVSAHVGDKRIALWDVMNEPTATHLAQTPAGKKLIDQFVAHNCALVKRLDPTHSITVGVAKWDNQDVIDLVDVLSCHSYAKGVEAFRSDVTRTRDQARAAGKPWIVTECCNPAAGSTYEMVMPVLRETEVGHLVWQLIIGRDQFNAASGLVYPDGTVRRIAQIEAVMNAPASGFVEKPDDVYRLNPPQPSPPSALHAFVYRDVYGIPHIFADSEAAAAYAIAQAQCEDMGMQVFNSLRCGIGRKAEVFGEGVFESDRMMHLWRVRETAEKIWNESPPRTRRFLQGFCDGLNDYRKDHPDECKTALEANPVQVIALFRWTDVSPSHGIVQMSASAAAKLPPPEMDFPNQSSSWAIGPSRTASGRPILFIDPHWPAEGQTSWWKFHVHAGRMQAGGFAVPGLPVVGLGYTDGVAWAGTAGGADSADVFELKTNPKNPDQYWYDGRWRDMEVREETIRVKTAPDQFEERILRIRESVHGPVVLESDGRVFAGAICGVGDTKRVEQWLAMNRAQSTEELRDAFRMDQAVWLNLTYASRDGNIGYIQTGMCPLRPSGPHDLLAVVDGTRSSANWQGRIPFDELPQLHDPETGWL